VLKKERQDAIAELVNQESFASVKAISKRLDVSEMTVRRDLEDLSADGRLTRVHGGARSLLGSRGLVMPREFTTAEKHRLHMAEKGKIAREAAKLIMPNQTIYLGPGTTCEALAREISGLDVRIITNSLLIFEAIREMEGPEVILIGGDYRASVGSFVGGLAERMVELVGIDKAFVGANGIFGGKIWGSNTIEGNFLRIALNSATERYVLVDSSKIGRRDFYGFYDLIETDALVTDSLIAEEDMATLGQLTQVLRTN